MAALNLFPARVRFVNDDGTLTNEAYRALQIVFARVGGPLGDSGTDVFGQVFGAPTDSANNLSNALSDVVQPANFATDYYSDVIQYQASSKDFIGLMLPEVMQPVNDPNGVFSTLAVSGNATIGGTLSLAAGTVGLPSMYWSTDTTTGFYRIGANNNGYAVSGVKVLDILSTGLSVTGVVSASQAGGYGFNLSGATTSFRGMLLGSTGATTVLGIEGSTGGSFVTGSPGYATCLVTFDANPVIIGVSNAEKLRATTTGVAVTGTLSSTGALTTPGGATFHTTSTALTNGAGAGAGTITNAPAAGNPSKWIGISDNGTIRYIPAW